MTRRGKRPPVRRRVVEPTDAPPPPLPPLSLAPPQGRPRPQSAADRSTTAGRAAERTTQQAARRRSRRKRRRALSERLGLPERKPDPPPLETNELRVVQLGTAAWLLAFLILLPYYDRLMRAGHGWWLWTCLAGFGLGLWGSYLVRRHRAARARTPGAGAVPDHTPTPSRDPGSGS